MPRIIRSPTDRDPTGRDREFVKFARDHRRDLLRTATLLSAGDEAFAEDLVQTTLTRLYLSWGRVRRADSPLAYARRSLTHVFIDETRRAHRRRARDRGRSAAPGRRHDAARPGPQRGGTVPSP